MDPRKRNKKGQVAPEADVGHANDGLVMDELAEKNRGPTFSDVAGEVHSGIEAFHLLANVKSSAAKWKSYISTRRLKKRTQDGVADAGQAGANGIQLRTEGGIGLDDIHDEYSNPMSARQSVPDMDPKMRVASNRAFIQYFAKLGQSLHDEEIINLEFVHTLITSGADINCTDKYGQTVLHEVARAWHVDVAKFLLEHGADIDLQDDYGRTPLHVAAAVDYPEMVNLLIERGADKESKTKEENQTPVFYAAKNDACSSLKALIKQGCKFMKEKDFKGRTPIHVAAELDRSETARILLELNAPVWIPDNEGIRAITWMINKMPPVAHEALNQFHLTDRPNRKQYFYLNFLIRDKDKDPEGVAQTPLHGVTAFKQYDLIMHEVFIRLCAVMWSRFGRFWALFNLGLNFMYIVMWTVIGVTVKYDERHDYTFPDDIWRLVLWILAILLTVYQIFEEVMDFIRSQRSHAAFEKKRIAEVERDLKFCHPRWPGESKYLKEEIEMIVDLKPKYFSDMWNIFDWLCYTLLVVCVITHVVDVAAHTESTARLHIRVMSVTIILLWLRLMKNARAFSLLGPFVVMLGHMMGDCVKFMFLYLEFYIPFLCAFWMIFGGTKKSEANPEESVTVDGYHYFGQLFYSMFRLTLVDEYDYGNMKLIDDVMADILLTAWILLSSILCLNLFIALLSDTFQRVYDNAQANAVMQRAITIINTWEGINKESKEKFWKYIEDECSPLVDLYDDDMTTPGDEDLKKVTIQIKEDLDDFQEMFKLQFGDPRNSYLVRQKQNDLPKPGGGSGRGGAVVSKELFESEVRDIRDSLKNVQVQQEAMAVRMRKDMTSVKSMLKQLLGQGGQGGQGDGAYREIVDASLHGEHTPIAKLRRKKKKSEKAEEPESMLDIGATEFTPATFHDPSEPIGVPAMDLSSFSSLQQPTDADC